MRYTFLPLDPGLAHAEHAGFHGTRPRLAVEQRESLCRGIAFLLVLTLSCLLIVYAPLIWGDPDWAAAGVMSSPSASAYPPAESSSAAVRR